MDIEETERKAKKREAEKRKAIEKNKYQRITRPFRDKNHYTGPEPGDIASCYDPFEDSHEEWLLPKTSPIGGFQQVNNSTSSEEDDDNYDRNIRQGKKKRKREEMENDDNNKEEEDPRKVRVSVELPKKFIHLYDEYQSTEKVLADLEKLEENLHEAKQTEIQVLQGYKDVMRNCLAGSGAQDIETWKARLKKVDLKLVRLYSEYYSSLENVCRQEEEEEGKHRQESSSSLQPSQSQSQSSSASSVPHP